MVEREKTHKRVIIIVVTVVLVCVIAGVVGTVIEMTQPVKDVTWRMTDAWAIAWTADTLGDEKTRETLRKQFRQIKYMELTDFSEGVVPYIGICRALSLPINDEEVLVCLRQWYVPDQKLFTHMLSWIQDGTTSLENSLGATLMLLREYPEVLQWDDEFHLREGILAGVQEFSYLMPEDGKTEHVSGGVCVWLVGLLSEIDGEDYTWALPEKILDWYQIWEQHIASQGGIADRTRWEISRILNQRVSCTEAQSWFDTLDERSAATLDNTNLLTLLRQLWPMLNTSANPVFLDALQVRVREMARDFTVDKFP